MRHVADLENQGYVHTHSAVERAGLSSLNEGQIVRYEIESARGKESAINLGMAGFGMTASISENHYQRCEAIISASPEERASCSTSRVVTTNDLRDVCPNVVLIATSAASRPLAIRIRPIRGMLWRASNVCQRPPTNASNQALKSIGDPVSESSP